MKVKEAIAQAKALLSDSYAGNAMSGVRLEEVEFDEPSDSWLITLGFLRSAAEAKVAIVTQALAHDAPPTRTYQVVKVPNDTSATPSMTIREF